MNLDSLLRPLVDIARVAGDEILEIYDAGFDIFEKEDLSPLTSADLASHRYIVAALEQLTPDWHLMSEESSEISWETRKSWTRYWMIDPLDGTKEFIKRNGEFTVNIALIQDHKPVLGVVHVPVTGTTYYGASDVGAFCMQGNDEPRRIHTRPAPQKDLIVVGSRSHKSPRLQQYLDALGEHQLTSMGSSLKFCLVAEGKADLYPRMGPTSEWDTAAAQAVVEAAGGAVTYTNNEPLQYNFKESVLNPEFLVSGDISRDWSEFVPPGPTHED
jgi:3'(2'), 5'-bisphosphate nucleotidase